jgi:molybdopterin/thiamine biosynthesis adenylyltransferase
MKMTDVLLKVSDERDVIHSITMRNLRAYFGRTLVCDCGHESIIENPPLSCGSCSMQPSLLKLDPRQWWNQPLLEASRILVIGCGAIGNEVVKNLVMMGVQNFTLIDFDAVEPHNLSRSVLFNNASLERAATNRKVDVMMEGIHLLQSKVNVTAIYGGILDPISKEMGKDMSWELSLNENDLQKLGQEHDLCIIATDGVAPKAFASLALYRILPIVQGAMNSTGNFGLVRASLPLVTACVMCPTTEDVVKLDDSGYAPEYIQRIRSMTGSGGCDGFIEAAGAAGFADTTSLIGSVMASQIALISMGWAAYQFSEGIEWPTPTPLWDSVQKVSGRAPHLNKTIEIKPINTPRGPVCVNGCCDKMEMIMSENTDSPRYNALNATGNGVVAPNTTKRKLGDS